MVVLVAARAIATLALVRKAAAQEQSSSLNYKSARQDNDRNGARFAHHVASAFQGRITVRSETTVPHGPILRLFGQLLVSATAAQPRHLGATARTCAEGRQVISGTSLKMLAL